MNSTATVPSGVSAVVTTADGTTETLTLASSAVVRGLTMLLVSFMTTSKATFSAVEKPFSVLGDTARVTPVSAFTISEFSAEMVPAAKKVLVERDLKTVPS